MSNFQHQDDLLEVKALEGIPNFAQVHRRAKGAMGQGLRYEKKCHLHFQRKFILYVASPWFAYRTKYKPQVWNYAQPDALLFDFQRGVVTIIEMKYSHTADAYFQLIDKYLPLMRKFLGTELWHFSTVEVVWWYDKAVAFPTKIRLREDVSLVQPGEFAVHICRP